MHEHFHLAKGISKGEAILMFNNATHKVIKDSFKHAQCISVATYYT
jgi:hypothetical protein